MAQSRVLVTPDDQGPIVNVVTWLCVAGSGCIVAAKVVTKIARYRRLNSDDFAAITALIVNIGCAITTATQVNAGLGRHSDDLPQDQIDSFEKGEYALQMLLVISLMLSQISTLRFLSTLAVDLLHHRLVGSLVASAVIWAIISLFVVAFQCNLPNPWQLETTTCIRMDVFWDFYGAVESAIYFLLFSIPVYLVAQLQISVRKKTGVAFAFGGNIAVIPPLIIRSIYLDAAAGSQDPTWDYFNPVLLSQVTVNVALIAASITFVKPFLDSIYTGLLSADLRQLSVSEGTLETRRARLMHMLDAIKAPPPLPRQTIDSDVVRLYGLRTEREPNPVMVDFLNATAQAQADAQARAENVPLTAEENVDQSTSVANAGESGSDVTGKIIPVDADQS